MNDYKRTSSWSLLEQALKEATEIKTPELTIDLPHNQKLTIGHLKPDTIVEIATWKGSGAPDENSVRMLIGASLQNGAEMAAENEAAAAAVVADAVENVVEAVAAASPVEEDLMQPEAASVEAVMAPPMPLGGPSTPNAWEMIQKLEAEKTHSSETQFQKELGRKQIRKMAEKRSLRFNLLATLGGFTSAVLILAGLNLTGLLAFDHPQVGPELPLGSATSSLIAIVPNSSAEPGDFAMATLNGERNLVRVDSVGTGNYTVSTMAGSQVISTNQLDGKMSFLIPFIGIFWDLVGQ